jgi:hypothetical protein
VKAKVRTGKNVKDVGLKIVQMTAKKEALSTAPDAHFVMRISFRQERVVETRAITVIAKAQVVAFAIIAMLVVLLNFTAITIDQA